DSKNYSCSYDALFTILYNIWIQTPTDFYTRIAMRNPFMTHLENLFREMKNNLISPEDARNIIRPSIHNHNPDYFPWGKKGVNMVHLSELFFKIRAKTIVYKYFKCTSCSSNYTETSNSFLFVQLHEFEGTSTQKWFNFLTKNNPSSQMCNNCNQNMMAYMKFSRLPALLALDIYAQNTSISHKLNVKIWDEPKTLRLAGIIYFGKAHFTARIVDKNEEVWWHDGMKTQNKCKNEGNLHNITPHKLKNLKGRKACLVIYEACTK
ncbi:hypothetical protein BD410DRAFT_735480, partial [Rickenella mellea]